VFLLRSVVVREFRMGIGNLRFGLQPLETGHMAVDIPQEREHQLSLEHSTVR
jgi:hypothetical protein